MNSEGPASNCPGNPDRLGTFRGPDGNVCEHAASQACPVRTISARGGHARTDPTLPACVHHPTSRCPENAGQLTSVTTRPVKPLAQPTRTRPVCNGASRDRHIHEGPLAASAECEGRGLRRMPSSTTLAHPKPASHPQHAPHTRLAPKRHADIPDLDQLASARARPRSAPDWADIARPQRAG